MARDLNLLNITFERQTSILASTLNYSTNFTNFLKTMDDQNVIGPLYLRLPGNKNLAITPFKAMHLAHLCSLQNKRPFPGPPSTRLLPL